MSTRYRVVAIEPAVAEEIRAARADRFGNTGLREVTADVTPGYPCRVCLRDAESGEKLLLCSYSPFAQAHPYRTVGPIFIHAERCVPAGTAALALAELPDQLRRRLLSLRAYDAAGFLLEGEVVEGAAAGPVIERLFADPRVERLHVHNARPGCFAAQIERG